MTRVWIVDVGSGNVGNLVKTLKQLNCDPIVCCLPPPSFDVICLAGMGDFGYVMRRLRERRLDSFITECLETGVRLVGICVGFQVLFESSEESPGDVGLSLYGGSLKKISNINGTATSLHIGWNSVYTKVGHETQSYGLLPDAYFCHQFALPADVNDLKRLDGSIGESQEILIANSPQPIVAGFSCGNIHGFQFHPELSGDLGVLLLKRTLNL